MELSDVKGIGEKRVQALQAAGIATVQDLAQVDLRNNIAVDGVTRDNLKALKVRARQALRDEGIGFEKAPYGTGPMGRQPDKVVKPGFLRRLFRRT